MSDTQRTGEEPPKCPHCGGNIGFNLVARARSESRMVFKVAPAPGDLLTAKNLGGAITAFGGLMKSLGKDLNIPTEVLVERLETTSDGEISIHVLIARWEDHTHSAANRKARKKEAAHVE